MLVNTDDEVYRVSQDWLGPPGVTTPWRARYSAYGIGLVLTILIMFIERQIGIQFGVFPTAWALLIAVVLTRWIGRRMDSDRTLVHVAESFWNEITTPRQRTGLQGGTPRPRAVTITPDPQPLAPTTIKVPRTDRSDAGSGADSKETP